MLFGHMARKIIVEANIGEFDISPEYVIENWIAPRYKSVLSRAAFGSINKQSDFGFNTVGHLTTGTVTVVNGDATVVASDPVFSASLVGYYFVASNTAVWYRIASYTSATSIELDTPYVDDSGSDLGYRIVKRQYAIDPSLRWIIDIKLGARHELIKVSAEKLDEISPTRIWQSSVPQYWCPVGWNQTTGERLIEIYPPADQTYRLDATGYLDIDEPAASASPLRGFDDRVLIEGCLSDALKFRASKIAPTSIEAMRALLDLARSHERDYERLLQTLDEFESKDAPQRRTRLLWRQSDNFYPDIITAEQEVYYFRPPY